MLSNCLRLFFNENNFRCVKYIKNYDGDTITFNISGLHSLIGKKIKIRLSGVDTPEINTKDKCEKEKGQTAKRLVENLFKNSKRIDLENVKRGKYFRMVADIIIDGKSLTAGYISSPTTLSISFSVFLESSNTPLKKMCISSCV